MGRGLATIAGAALALLAGACSRGDSAGDADLAGAEKIACALGAGTAFVPACRLERSSRGAEQLYIVHHPDGGFRSFTVLANGAGLAAADGAEPAQQALAGDVLEVAVGQDRYRFPVSAQAAAKDTGAGTGTGTDTGTAMDTGGADGAR